MFVCIACKHPELEWYPQCPKCGEWSSLKATNAERERAEEIVRARRADLLAASGVQRDDDAENDVSIDDAEIARTVTELPIRITNVPLDVVLARYVTTIDAIDYALGGGFVIGSCVMLAAEPGTGKTTALLQSLAGCAKWNHLRVLYVTGEESCAQVAMTAQRVGALCDDIYIVAETDPEQIVAHAEALDVDIIAIDSISTMASAELDQVAGSPLQVRACASRLCAYAKENDLVLANICHITKDGAISGPKFLEHLVDATFYLEAIEGTELVRLVPYKNRYGSKMRIGRLKMTEKGLETVGRFVRENGDVKPDESIVD